MSQLISTVSFIITIRLYVEVTKMTTEYQPELQATAKDLDEAKRVLAAGADAVFVGNQQFGNRIAGDFSIAMIEEITQFAHELDKKVYVMVNAIYHNEHLQTLPDYLIAINDMQVDGIVAGDQSIYQLLQDLDVSLPLIWNPATLSTNYQTLRFWSARGLRRAALSNELRLDASIEIKQHLDRAVDIQVHGMTCIFQSKRKLVKNYYDHIDRPYDPEIERYIREDKKSETHYPIFEDSNGTHIMSTEDLMMIDYLDEILAGKIDGLKIEGLLKSTDYNEQIVKIYREAIDAYLDDPAVYQMKKAGYRQAIYQIQPDARKLNTGFYFKEQIY
ncbi:peptidase U32 family protein [Streptohalobacillus salinus]|nr:peptidase U32 family protein [Streptohalobacillus salinus]